MRTVSLEELLEAGCHFGHQVQRQNPKARDFIFEARDNIHIIDLAKTKEGLEEAARFVKEIAQKEDSSIIIVGTKRQAQQIVEEEILRAQQSGANNVFFVTNRWIGGTLTNFSEVSKNYKKLRDITELLQSFDARDKYTKRELGMFEKEKQKLESFYKGVAGIVTKPSIMYIIDTHNEGLAIAEAHSEGVPVIGIVDTNANPLEVDYPIPANDDAAGSVKLITAYIMDAWIEGKTKKGAGKNEEDKNDQGEKKTTKAKDTKDKAFKASDKLVKEKEIKESSVVGKESTAKEVATQSKKKASNTKKLTGEK